LVRVFVGLELKWAQQFARLLGAAGRRHLRLPSLPGPAAVEESVFWCTWILFIYHALP